MELRSAGELRRNEQLARTGPKKAEESATARKAPARPAADKVSLSRQAVAFLEERNRRMWQYQQEQEQRRQADSAKSRPKGMEKELDVLSKCQKIAAAIMKGNRVPPEDLRYLMEHDQEGYKLAMAMRRHNPDPEDEESVLDDEDKNGGVEGSTSEETCSVETAGASEGGEGAPASAE